MPKRWGVTLDPRNVERYCCKFCLKRYDWAHLAWQGYSVKAREAAALILWKRLTIIEGRWHNTWGFELVHWMHFAVQDNVHKTHISMQCTTAIISTRSQHSTLLRLEMQQDLMGTISIPACYWDSHYLTHLDETWKAEFILRFQFWPAMKHLLAAFTTKAYWWIRTKADKFWPDAWWPRR